MIELSIATALFSMGLSGLSMLMLTANQGTADAQYRTVAAVQAASLAEMVLMNSGALGHYIYPPEESDESCLEVDCSGEAMVGENIRFWRDQLGMDLPNGTGLICRDSTPDDGSVGEPSCDGAGGVVIKIFWDEPPRHGGGGGRPLRFVSRLPW